MLRGSLTLTHRVAVQITNLDTHAIRPKQRERIPVPRLDQPSHDLVVRWDVSLPAHSQRAVALDYVVRVHTSVVGFELP